MAQNKAFVTASVVAENSFTAALTINAGERVAISSSGGATSTTVTLQRRFDGSNWRDVQSWVADVEASYQADAAAELRLGVKTGGYGSGTQVCRLQVG
jgi:hypothetical protein